MAEKALVESQLTDAAELVGRLDKAGSAPSIVLWNYFSDASEWRLLIAGTSFDPILARNEAQAYQRVAEALNQPSPLTSLSIGEVRLQQTDSPLMKVVKFLIRTGASTLSRSHFMRTTVNGIFLEEMIVLRST